MPLVDDVGLRDDWPVAKEPGEVISDIPLPVLILEG